MKLRVHVPGVREDALRDARRVGARAKVEQRTLGVDTRARVRERRGGALKGERVLVHVARVGE